MLVSRAAGNREPITSSFSAGLEKANSTEPGIHMKP